VRHDADAVRTRWYAKLVFAAGFLLTATTGFGLWLAPRAVGPDFAWEIKAPLTAAFMGAWYTGAAAALLLGLLEPVWRRARTVLVIALALTTTSLVTTLRFHEAFRLGEGTTLQQGIAWIWVLVYAALPPAVLAVLVVHERAERRVRAGVAEPYAGWTRAVFLVTAAGCGALGLWLTAAPRALVAVWPWTLNDLPASIVGTWALTVAIGSAWALYETDWQRTRIALRPIQLALALLLVAAVRFDDAFRGSALSVAVYLTAVSALLGAFSAIPFAQRRHLAAAAEGADEQPAPPAIEAGARPQQG
jgi:hypothetical protein